MSQISILDTLQAVSVPSEKRALAARYREAAQNLIATAEVLEAEAAAEERELPSKCFHLYPDETQVPLSKRDVCVLCGYVKPKP